MTDLLERGDEIAFLTTALAAAARGTGAVALVTGEAGIGKSAVVTRLAREVERTKGGRLLWGACDALFTPRPLGPLHDVARQTGGTLLASVAADADRETLFSALLDELHRGAPTVLVVEDAHWADEATADLLKFVGRRIARAPALLVVTYRDDEVGPSHPLRTVLGDIPSAVMRRVPLRPLSPAAVSALARRAGRGDAGLHAATGGNPFYVTEVLADNDDEIPATVRDAVLARVARLPQAARAIAELASVVPTPIEPWLVGRLLAPPPEALEACTAMGMVRRDDGALAFRHELARRAVEDSLPDVRRRALHADCLAALLARHDSVDPARLVHHADGAGDAESVLRWAPVAAERAARVGAHRDSAALYERLINAADVLVDALPAAERAAILERHAYECYLTDRINDALTSRHAALTLWRALGDRTREGDTLRWLSRLSWFAGRREDADRHAADAVAALEPLGPGHELGMAFSNRAQLAALANDVDNAVTWGTRAIAIGEALDDAEILAHALNNVGTAEYSAGRPGGRERLERSLAVALAHGLQEHVARAYTNLGSASVKLRAYEDAKRFLEAGLAYCEARDLDSWTLYKLAWRSRLRFECGDWNGAAGDAAEVLGHRGAATISRIPALAVLGRVRRHRDDPGWRSLLNEAQVLAAGTREAQRICPVACARAEAAWLDGDVSLAAAEAAAGWAVVQERALPWEAAEPALWAWRTGCAIPQDAVLPAVVARQVAGDWRGAAAEWGRLGCPYEQALALADGDTEDALRDALVTLERLGSTAGAAYVRRRLRALGVRVPRGAHSSTRGNPAGLTARQLEILALVSAGLRDAEIAERLFLSTKTVGHHVSAILAKLDVHTRGAAVAAARERGIG